MQALNRLRKGLLNALRQFSINKQWMLRIFFFTKEKLAFIWQSIKSLKSLINIDPMLYRGLGCPNPAKNTY